MADWIGYQWLVEHYGISPVQAFRTDSAIAKSRATTREDGYVHEYYPPVARPADNLIGHLTFAFKHEGGKAMKTAITIGFNDGANVEVLTGLDKDSTVLLPDKVTLTDKQEVTAKPNP